MVVCLQCHGFYARLKTNDNENTCLRPGRQTSPSYQPPVESSAAWLCQPVPPSWGQESGITLYNTNCLGEARDWSRPIRFRPLGPLDSRYFCAPKSRAAKHMMLPEMPWCYGYVDVVVIAGCAFDSERSFGTGC